MSFMGSSTSSSKHGGQGGGHHEDNKKLEGILRQFDGKEGDVREMIREMCDKIRDEFKQDNVLVIQHDHENKLHLKDVRAQAHCELKDREKGKRRFGARVFGEGTLNDARNFQGRDEQLAGWASWEMQGDKVVFRRPHSENDRKRLDLNDSGRQ